MTTSFDALQEETRTLALLDSRPEPRPSAALRLGAGLALVLVPILLGVLF